ncbi:MAG: VWA domain-containing protein [Planctomycetota bacterium]
MKSFRVGVKLKFQCSCGKRVVVDAQQKGSGNCPRCKMPLNVPSQGSSESLSILCVCGAVLPSAQEQCSICQKPLYEIEDKPLLFNSSSPFPPSTSAKPFFLPRTPQKTFFIALTLCVSALILQLFLFPSPTPNPEDSLNYLASLEKEKKETKPAEEPQAEESKGLTFIREMGSGLDPENITPIEEIPLMAQSEAPKSNEKFFEAIPMDPVVLEEELPLKQEIPIKEDPKIEAVMPLIEKEIPETKEIPEQEKIVPVQKKPEKLEQTEQAPLPSATPEIQKLLKQLKSTSAEEILNSLDQLAKIAKDPSRRLEASAALPEILPYLSANVWQVRSSTAYALGQMERFEAVLPLIERFKKEKGRPCIEIREALTQITHLDFGADPKRWENFWNTQQGRFVRPKLSTPQAANGSFYGVPLLSNRLIFVVDTSGSMSALAEYRGESSETVTVNQFQPSTRLDVAKKELIKQIKGFNEKIRFNIIFFDSNLRLLSRTLLPATPGNKSIALTFIGRQKPDGGTNIHDSLLKALETNEADTIIFLTDGAPSAGAIVNPPDILIAIHQVNQYKRTKIYVIGIQAIGAETFLEQLAIQNFGAYTSK